MIKVRMEPTSSVKPHPANPRRDHDVDAIARSIAAFGFRQPIVVWDGDGCVLAGHGRLLAAQQLGLKEVPVHHVGADEMTEARARGYRLADNKSAEASQWDDALLLAELEALDAAERADAGFSVAYLDDLRRRQELEALATDPNEDEVHEPPAQPVSRLGDLWQLGDHLLFCGDATSEVHVAQLGDHGHLMVTDPPYGVEYDPAWRNKPGGLQAWKASRSLAALQNDDVVDWTSAWQLFVGDVAYVWTASGGDHLLDSAAGLKRAGFEIRNLIIWAKQHFVIGRGHYHYLHEPCWYAVRKGKTAHWRGARDQTTVWHAANAGAFGGSTDGEEKTDHSTQKPVEVMRKPMLNNSNKGDLVYDPFVGSGTTIIAAEQTGRRARCIDLEPKFVDVSVLRWQAFTGRRATLNGQMYEEVAAARIGAAASAA